MTDKVRRRLGPGEPVAGEVASTIAEVIQRLAQGGFLDDRSYAEAKVGSLLRRGASLRAVRSKLRGKGVGEETIAAALAGHSPDELALARRYAERRRLGPWRTRPDPKARDRDLASLCRAGFPYAIARAALEPES
nr:regulatory protein RecX [Enterovirga sp. DB1703]